MVSPFTIKDSDWIRQSFAVPNTALDATGAQNDTTRRTFSTNQHKWTDTTLGGNFEINPPPQFTHTCDLRPAQNRLTGSPGMGRYYSENIDDNSQRIYIRCGVPQFNSLTTFFTGFYNTGAGSLARTGRATGVFYALGRAAGFVVSVMNWLPLAVHLLGVGYRFFLQKPSSKFYYLKPTMPLYWNAVQTIVNQITVNRGIVPRLGTGSVTTTSSTDANGNVTDTPSGDLAQGYGWDDGGTSKLRSLFSGMSRDIFTAGGEINVYALATRATRMQHKYYQAIEAAIAGDTAPDLATAFSSVIAETYQDSPPDFGVYMGKWSGSADANGNLTTNAIPEATPSASTPADDGSSTGSSATGNQTSDSGVEQLVNSTTGSDGFRDFLSAEFDDGSEFVCFRVNATGSVSESFSSNTADSEIANKINSMSSSSRSTEFDLAGGNIFGGNPLGDVIGGVLSAAKDFASGLSDQLKISGIAALAGAAFVDIPKRWDSSSTTYGRGMSYTVNLASPYGNAYSQLMNIEIPLACLLALVLPLSTGKQSYTSPFLVEVYDKGRCQTRLGIVDSMTITRGTGNLGFTNEGHVMGIDVSFSILDLSSVMHMPISQGISFSAAAAGAVAGGALGGVAGAVAGFSLGAIAAGAFDEDTIFTDYMAVLGAMGLADQIYPWRKYKLNLTKQMANFDTWLSWGHFASWTGNTPPGRLVSMIYKGIEH